MGGSRDGGAPGPRYLRSSRANYSLPPADPEPETIPDLPPSRSPSPEREWVTGLRKRKLCLLLIGLTILTLIAIASLVLNILIIFVLQMNHHGMRSLQFQDAIDAETGNEEPVVQFLGPNVHLGSVVSHSGRIYGPAEAELRIFGSRILVNTAEHGPRFVLQEGLCRFENIKKRDGGRPLFSAQHPLVTVDDRIKKLSTGQIITNKLRSPINANLTFLVENISLRGNEGIQATAKKVNVSSSAEIHLQTTKDGAIRFAGRAVFIGAGDRPLPISTSPGMTASMDADRICICAGVKPKLFTVPGNRPCIAQANECN